MKRTAYRLTRTAAAISLGGTRACVLVLACAFGAAPQTKCVSEVQKMEKEQFTVGKIAGFDNTAAAEEATLRLQDSGAYTLSKKSPLFEVWVRMISDYEASGMPLYVEFDPATRRVSEIFQPLKREIESVASEPKGDQLEVNILMAPSLYHLKTTRGNYREMRQRLEESMKNNQQVLVTAHPDTQEILDVRSP